MTSSSKILAIAAIAARSHLAYFSEVASRTIFLGVILFIFLQLWKVTYAQTGATRLGGLTLNEMLWYLVVTESILISAPKLARQVDEDVRGGGLSVKLIRPIAYPVYMLAANFGERIISFALTVTVGAMLATMLVGPPTSVVGLLFLFMALPLAFLIDASGHLLIGLAAFWMEDTSGLMLIYSRLTLLLGGTLLPVELLPDWLQPVVQFLPFSAIVYGPAHLFVKPGASELFWLLAKQAIALSVFALIIHCVYKKGLDQISANGG